ncbi:THAP domain containing 6 [Plakobranchus ocellatus]|uniref:THAP domain containing 6 n=1 Tax=Plakobranchus ocellatus TaxID=259542 RepID=A0AAV4BHL6_9GAST|nr:THAP domain containing 6 [Plakobranchus ocellatus]
MEKARSKYPSGGFCAAWGCSNRQTKGDGRKYHRFPRDPTRRKQLAAALKREGFVATEHSRICSDHFTKESYNGSGRLNGSAVPTVFNFPDHLRLMVNKLRTCVIHAVVQWITFNFSVPSNHVTLAAMLA